MIKLCQKINLQEMQCNRNGTANYVNLIRTSTVPMYPKYLASTLSTFRLMQEGPSTHSQQINQLQSGLRDAR